MSQQHIRRLQEWAVWYNYNVKLLPENDMQKQIDFFKVAVDGCFECIARCMEDIKSLEDGQKAEIMWLPGGDRPNGAMR